MSGIVGQNAGRDSGVVGTATSSIADNSVTTAKIAANAVDETKLKDGLVADFTEVVVTASDSILLGDATDSGKTKRDTVQGILDLVPAGVATFTSSDQSITSSGLSTLAHSLGAVPRVVKVFLRCLTAEHGYSIGDIITPTGDNSTSASDQYGFGSYVDATNVYVRIGSQATAAIKFRIKSTGSAALLVNTNWDLYVEASL